MGSEIGKYRHIITKKALSDKNNNFSYFNLEAMSRAMRELKPSTFKLWCYLNKNKDSYCFNLSQVAVTNFTGISRSSYLAAFNELYEKGYLVDTIIPRLNIEGYMFLEDRGQNLDTDYGTSD